MSWATKIACTAVLLSVFLFYCWILKNSPVKTESLIIKEVNGLPELTFSKLADLENRLAAELDAIPIHELDRIRNEELELFMTKFNKEEPAPTNQDTFFRIIFFVCLSVVGILFLLCLGRILIPRYRCNVHFNDSDCAPIVKNPSQEEFKKNYQTEKY